MPKVSESKILAVAIFGTFMEILDQTVMNVALPHIMAVFNATADRAQLIVSAYLMASAISTPAAAFLSDRFGIKRVYMASQIGFLLGSVLCGLSWDSESLIGFRILQGLSGGILNPLSMTFIYMNVPPEKRGSAMAMLGIPMMLAPVLGPTLGGYLVTYWDWRLVFYINVPIVLTAIAMGWVWIEDTPLVSSTFDYKGFTFAAVGFSSILYALSYAPTWHWTDWRIITLLTVGGFCIMMWIIIELTEKKPMLDLRMFKHRGYAIGIGLTFITTIGLYAIIFLLPLFLQQLRGLSAFDSGLMLLPQVVGAMIGMTISGRLYDKIGPRVPAVIGLFILGIMSLYMQILDVSTPDNLLRIMLFIRGMGMGLSMMPIMTYALSSVPNKLTAQASSLLNVSRTIFGSLSIAAFATLLDLFQKVNLANIIQSITPNSLMAMGFLSRIQALLMQSGLTSDASYQEAVIALYQYVSLRASVTAYDMNYVIGAIIVLLGVIPSLLLLPHGKIEKAGGSAEIAI
jgi:EmrB/QacA subfamily drug resistance transporter